MLITLLLMIIYLAFISMGLPDSLLGSTWPAMYEQMNVPVSYAGVLSMIISAGTILSSFFSDRLICRLGTGVVTAGSVCMTAAALLGFSYGNSFGIVCLWAIPLGLGAGSVDAALNNFVAQHYPAKHMNWLHCFWGIGATAGPVILSFWLARGKEWIMGYRTIGLVQLALSAILVLALPLWKKVEQEAVLKRSEVLQMEEKAECSGVVPVGSLLSLPGVKAVLVAFFCYHAVEMTIGLWSGSYLVLCRHVEAAAAAGFVSLFYVGMTGGRLAAGFLTDWLNERQMIRLGQIILATGVLLTAAGTTELLLKAAFLVMGAGCAPIYPSLLHATPGNFGYQHCQAIMGLQMSAAYVGTTCMAPLFGVLGGRFGYGLFAVYVLVLLGVMAGMVEKVNRSIGSR
ncbi:MAG: MFS transporter [Lachnospiraceae bacterium]|nr:MFS transporter [Lachnospiraceae bacterium]